MACEQFCDSFAMRTMDQTASRFNERATYSHNNNMDNITMNQPLMWGEVLNSFQRHGMSDAILQIRATAQQPSNA